MIDAIDYQNPDVARKYWLFCGDNWLQWKAATETNELDTEDAKRSIGATIDRGAYPTPTPLQATASYQGTNGSKFVRI